MDHNMFCFQCEQTAGCTGCTSRGVCGKDAQTAQVQDRLTGALIGLARAADTSPDAGPETWQLMIEGLFATLTNVNFDPDSLNALAGRVRAEKQRLVPDCAVCTAPCGRTGDYDLAQLWGAQEDIRSLKSLLLFGSRGMAAYAYHAMVLGYRDESVERFLSKALFAVGEDWSMEERAAGAGSTAVLADGMRPGQPALHGAAGQSQHRMLRQAFPGPCAVFRGARPVHHCVRP